MTSGGAGAPCRRQASRSAARRLSAVSRSRPSIRCSPSAVAWRRRAAAACMPASAATCARRMPLSSAADFTRRREAMATGSG